jgi:hypothetical protein
MPLTTLTELVRSRLADRSASWHVPARHERGPGVVSQAEVRAALKRRNRLDSSRPGYRRTNRVTPQG